MNPSSEFVARTCSQQHETQLLTPAPARRETEGRYVRESWLKVSRFKLTVCDHCDKSENRGFFSLHDLGDQMVTQSS
eukprot:NODE_4470_length_797_cov_2.391711_g3713_i0.p4 GENE.NODE_4470_length_797_cov_2.391711_g3713_i0~~NODE_4470_length_797_cov_2.391711_g3713_i0.p4  ORF type:complete len:77 (-),score=4.01 NODE_4470_length_797_cov_2.391711_g3713_i0:331-561(-)